MRFPREWVRHVHCLRVSWTFWCVCWQGEVRQERECVPWVREHWNTLRALLYHKCSGWNETEIPGSYVGSLGSVFMLPAIWCDSEARALATEAVLIKLESPLCNVVDRVDSIVGERCRVKGYEGNGHRHGFAGPSPPFASIWSHRSVLKLCTPVSGPSWESRFPGVLGLAFPFKHLYTWQIGEHVCQRRGVGSHQPV